jgi:hypothetical protein
MTKKPIASLIKLARVAILCRASRLSNRSSVSIVDSESGANPRVKVEAVFIGLLCSAYPKHGVCHRTLWRYSPRVAVHPSAIRNLVRRPAFGMHNPIYLTSTATTPVSHCDSNRVLLCGYSLGAFASLREILLLRPCVRLPVTNSSALVRSSHAIPQSNR